MSRNQGSARPSQLDPAVTEVIRQAVLQEFAAKGYKGMSMEGVARVAGVGKMTLYRRWAGKEEMTVGVLAGIEDVDEAVTPDTGDVVEDVVLMLKEFMDSIVQPPLGPIYLDLISEAHRNPRLAEALTELMDSPRRTRGAAVFERAKERGDLEPDFDVDLALDVLAGTLFWRAVARRRTVDRDYVRAMIDWLRLGRSAD